MAFEYIEDEALRAKALEEYNQSVEAMKSETAKQIQAEVEKATAGLKASQQKLLDEKKKIQEKYSQINDPEEALRALQLISGNEEVRLLAEGKFDEVVQRRLSTQTAQFEEQIKDLSTKYESTEMTATKYRSLYQDLIIENSITSAAIKAGILPSAVTDVLNRARQLFQVGEDERTVESRDANGKLRKTEDEKVLTPENWIESLKKVSPHFWPPSTAAGFHPGGGSTADDLEAEIQAAAKSGNQSRFRELREKQKKMKGIV